MDQLSDKDAFKLGFLTRCAEEQLVGGALQTRIKRASWFLPALLGLGVAGAAGYGAGSGVMGGAKNLLSGYAGLLGAAGAGGLTGGAALGYGLGNMTAPSISDDEIRAQELAQTYRVYADRARAKKRMTKKYREPRA
jgi:hypothetical protein